MDFDMDRMGLGGEGDGRSATDDTGELFVIGDFPGDFDGFGAHASAVEWARSEPGPDNEPIRSWVT
jgi:hypothetical protein